ncbi:nitrate- and nitrite sensing domain-containing protein [Methylomonas sp. SURF-2]|uniref:Nitrate- and nitrite sensing domain-containing protein n=1 Tax=Methylomonas subterranea TaxID=2952225 RepID=A0ABT1TI11_9GAMM|nr:nitrate- and nitrite sensing domain-containing protein [Methylomonas sp. SURF-2]MCQ8105104.1 nitrate- and nitrite sensing domain-containing protein [Methylomonas sp. SURF-2]
MPQALTLLLLTAGLIGAACTGMLYCRQRARLGQINSQLLHITINQELKEFLGNIQRHRGMVNGYLNGDASFKYKISVLQAEINRQAGQIARHLQTSECHRADFETIRNHWQELYPRVLSGSRAQSFEDHCRLISTVLHLIRDIAERSQLHRDSGCPFSFVEIVWHLLPDTAEAIGQSRAIGTGIAAAGRGLGTERIKLGFLVTRIRETVARLEQGLTRTPADMTGEKLQQVHGEVRSRINKLVTEIERELLSADRPNINPGGFFEHASRTLDSVFEFYDQGTAIARLTLETQLSDTRRGRNRSLTTVISSLALATMAATQLNL